MPLLALSWRSRKSPPARGGVAQSAGVVGEAFALSASFATRRKELPPPPQRRCDPSSGRRELSTHDSAFGTDDWRLTAGVWRLAQR
jgi:hypothetical protein